MKKLSELSIADLVALLIANNELMFFISKEQKHKIEEELSKRKTYIDWGQ